MTHATTAFQRFFAPLLLTAAACVTLPAAAQSLYWGTGSGKTESEQLKFGTTTSRDVSLGAMSVSTSSTKANSFWVYCLDPLNGANLPSAYTTTSLSNFITGTGTPTYTALFSATPYTSSSYNTGSSSTQYGLQANKTTVLNNLVELYSHAYEDSLNTSLKSAAFQYAIWSILAEAESSYGIDAGGLRAINISDSTGGVAAFRTQAAAYLTAVTSDNWGSVNGANLSASTSYTYQVFASSPLGGSQTFLSVSKATGGKVSEPASLALVGIAALGVIAGRRRKSKSAA